MFVTNQCVRIRKSNRNFGIEMQTHIAKWLHQSMDSKFNCSFVFFIFFVFNQCLIVSYRFYILFHCFIFKKPYFYCSFVTRHFLQWNNGWIKNNIKIETANKLSDALCSIQIKAHKTMAEKSLKSPKESKLKKKRNSIIDAKDTQCSIHRSFNGVGCLFVCCCVFLQL